MPGHIYLEKFGSDLVCHCECPRSLVSFPPQRDCPWCGCGWLFTCVKCRKAFAFARGTWVNETWEATARRDLPGLLRREPDADDIAPWVEAMKEMLRVVEVGKQYVYFDGAFVPADVNGMEYEGWHARHDLEFLPHAAALKDPSVIDDLLANRAYWQDRAVRRS